MAFGVTGIRMIVSMKNNQVHLVSWEDGTECTAEAFSARACNVSIPWCANAAEFAQHHITLSLLPEKDFPPIAIWQHLDRVYWSATNQWQSPAAVLGGETHGGTPYRVDDGIEDGRNVVLVVDDLPWPRAILYSLR
jgi:hypothetical protein